MSHTGVVLPDGSIVIMGGNNGNGVPADYGDTWRSTDNGRTWTLQNASAWEKRYEHVSAVLSDGSIILAGGTDAASVVYNDVWRSTDKGVTWTRQTPHAEWSGRYTTSFVALPDDSLVIMGGWSGS